MEVDIESSLANTGVERLTFSNGEPAIPLYLSKKIQISSRLPGSTFLWIPRWRDQRSLLFKLLFSSKDRHLRRNNRDICTSLTIQPNPVCILHHAVFAAWKPFDHQNCGVLPLVSPGRNCPTQGRSLGPCTEPRTEEVLGECLRMNEWIPGENDGPTHAGPPEQCLKRRTEMSSSRWGNGKRGEKN